MRASLMYDGVLSVADIEYTFMVPRMQLAWGRTGPQALLYMRGVQCCRHRIPSHGAQN